MNIGAIILKQAGEFRGAGKIHGVGAMRYTTPPRPKSTKKYKNTKVMNSLNSIKGIKGIKGIKRNLEMSKLDEAAKAFINMSRIDSFCKDVIAIFLLILLTHLK